MHEELKTGELKSLIRNRKLLLAGNTRLKIYGLLTCSSGKRMKKENRVFFKNESDAIQLGFRPCGNCLPGQYQKWKILFSRRLP
ncbi:MAG: Ada metal-binding domain-containing protein [Bacteroidota bacterium]